MTVTPQQGNAVVVAVGGTPVDAVLAVPTGLNGGYIVNPQLPGDQNVDPPELLIVNEVTDAGLGAYGTNVGLGPGQSYDLTVGSVNKVSVNAQTSGHRFTVVWF